MGGRIIEIGSDRRKARPAAQAAARSTVASRWRYGRGISYEAPFAAPILDQRRGNRQLLEGISRRRMTDARRRRDGCSVSAAASEAAGASSVSNVSWRSGNIKIHPGAPGAILAIAIGQNR